MLAPTLQAHGHASQSKQHARRKPKHDPATGYLFLTEPGCPCSVSVFFVLLFFFFFWGVSSKKNTPSSDFGVSPRTQLLSDSGPPAGATTPGRAGRSSETSRSRSRVGRSRWFFGLQCPKGRRTKQNAAAGCKKRLLGSHYVESKLLRLSLALTHFEALVVEQPLLGFT